MKCDAQIKNCISLFSNSFEWCFSTAIMYYLNKWFFVFVVVLYFFRSQNDIVYVQIFVTCVLSAFVQRFLKVFDCSNSFALLLWILFILCVCARILIFFFALIFRVFFSFVIINDFERVLRCLLLLLLFLLCERVCILWVNFARINSWLFVYGLYVWRISNVHT